MLESSDYACLYWFQGEEQVVGVRQDVKDQQNVAQSFQEDSQAFGTCSHSGQFDVNAELICSGYSQNECEHGPAIGSVSTSSFHDCGQDRDFGLLHEGVDTGSLQEAMQHIKTSIISSMSWAFGCHNVGDETVEGCGSASGMFDLEFLDIGEQIMIQQILDEQKLKQDTKVFTKVYFTTHRNYSNA